MCAAALASGGDDRDRRTATTRLRGCAAADDRRTHRLSPRAADPNSRTGADRRRSAAPIHRPGGGARLDLRAADQSAFRHPDPLRAGQGYRPEPAPLGARRAAQRRQARAHRAGPRAHLCAAAGERHRDGTAGRDRPRNRPGPFIPCIDDRHSCGRDHVPHLARLADHQSRARQRRLAHPHCADARQPPANGRHALRVSEAGHRAHRGRAVGRRVHHRGHRGRGGASVGGRTHRGYRAGMCLVDGARLFDASLGGGPAGGHRAHLRIRRLGVVAGVRPSRAARRARAADLAVRCPLREILPPG